MSNKYNENPYLEAKNAPVSTTPPWLMEATASTTSGYKQVALEDDMDGTVHINLNSHTSNSFSSGYPTAPGSSYGFTSSNNNKKPANTAKPNTPPEEIDPAIPRMITYTRVINLALSVGMILISLLAILTTQSATTGVLACYVVVFACLLCCFETHLKQVSKMIALNFGFMYSAKSRAVFMIFIGTIMFSFSLFGKVLALCMIANAGFNIFILFKYPQFDDVQRDHATSEIRDFLQSNPAFAQTVVAAGAGVVQSNPEIASQGFRAVLSSMFTSSSSNNNNNSNSTHNAMDAESVNRSSYVSV